MKHYEDLFPIQEGLDQIIIDRIGIPENFLFQEKMMALLVEIGEFANETRCFKFWSTKPASAKKIIIEEYSDCLHFLLSIGNYIEFTKKFKLDTIDINSDIDGDLTELFIEFFHTVVHFRNVPTPMNYLDMWDYFMSIGRKLGFSQKEVHNAYMKKNEINHERQASGY